MTRTRRNLLQLSAGAVVSVLARPALAVEPDGDHARWLADFADGREIRNGGLFLSPLTPPLTLQQMINALPESPAGEIDFGGEMGNEGVEW